LKNLELASEGLAATHSLHHLITVLPAITPPLVEKQDSRPSKWNFRHIDNTEPIAEPYSPEALVEK
jgi:hypothetical protein